MNWAQAFHDVGLAYAAGAGVIGLGWAISKIC